MIKPSVISSLNSISTSSARISRSYFSFRLFSITLAWATVLLVTSSMTPTSSPALTHTSMVRLLPFRWLPSVGFCRIMVPLGYSSLNSLPFSTRVKISFTPAILAACSGVYPSTEGTTKVWGSWLCCWMDSETILNSTAARARASTMATPTSTFTPAPPPPRRGGS